MTDKELEVFGIDREALCDQTNNTDAEGWTSWVGQIGPPANLSEVSVESPTGPMQSAEVQVLLHNLQAWIGSPNDSVHP